MKGFKGLLAFIVTASLLLGIFFTPIFLPHRYWKNKANKLSAKIIQLEKLLKQQEEKVKRKTEELEQYRRQGKNDERYLENIKAKEELIEILEEVAKGYIFSLDRAKKQYETALHNILQLKDTKDRCR